MNTRQTLLFILLLAVIIGSGWLLDGGLQDLSVSRSGPDAFVSGMHLDIMDERGKLRYRVTASTMVHYPDSDLLELQRPLIDLEQRNGSIWRIRAETGETTDSGDLIRLQGKVDIHRSGSSGPLQVRTRDLLVRPQQSYATTDSAATITTPGHRVDAVGLEADLDKNTLELHNHVRGRIDAAG
ncbi:MAG: LPS export ABC transporter periplasmic protein LptC [Gammaproteobacteria bacterium]